METVLYIIGGIVLLLAFAGLQRIFFPHKMVDGYMDLDKLKEVCPEIFDRKQEDNKSKN